MKALNFEIQALCTDIDGTLLNSSRQLSPRTISTLTAIGKNIPIILASSRMPSAMVHLQQELEITHMPLICYNGGYVIGYEKKGSSPLIFENVSIPVSLVSSILSLTKGTKVHVSLYSEDSWYAPVMDQWTQREERITKVKAQLKSGQDVVDQWAKTNSGAHKVMCMGPENEINSLQQELNVRFVSDLHIYRSRPTYLEIAPRSISKASGLKRLYETAYRIDPQRTIAFGDNYNDVDLLQSVGWGVAVENAIDEVKVVADEITERSVNDGVAICAEKYLL